MTEWYARVDSQLRADLAKATTTWSVALAWEQYRERRATWFGLWTGVIAGIVAALAVPHVPSGAITALPGEDSVSVLAAQVQMFESASPDPLVVAFAAGVPVAFVTGLVVIIFLSRLHYRHGVPRVERTGKLRPSRKSRAVTPPEDRLL